MKIFIVTLLLATPILTLSQANGSFSFETDTAKKEIRVLYNGQLMTAYCYYDSSRKPFLGLVNTIEGITVTRSYPFKMVPGERTDHPHHTGIWLNYESVNGLDFWNNSTAIPPERRGHYGTIVHTGVGEMQTKANTARLTVFCHWISPENKVLLKEATIFHFMMNSKTFLVSRTTKLTAVDTTVEFKDVKDGLFAIRVARELEQPSKEPSNYVDEKGNISDTPPPGKEPTGQYTSSNGLKGDSVWGTRANWVMLQGKKEGKEIIIAIFDHPDNPGYPAYWHARGYGLFAVNPLGQKVFSKGEKELNLTLKPGENVTFRFSLIVSTDKIGVQEIEKLASAFKQNF